LSRISDTFVFPVLEIETDLTVPAHDDNKINERKRGIIEYDLILNNLPFTALFKNLIFIYFILHPD
jgi:hypothetical protein